MESAHIAYCDFIVRGVGLDAKDFTGKSDPYIVIKCPTKVIMRRNIFEYELNMMVQEEGFSTYPPSPSGAILRNSQGTIIAEDYDKSNGNILTSVVATVNTGSHRYAFKTHPQTDGYKEIYESEVVKATLDPQWNPFRLGFYEMCRGNSLVELLIECYDWDRFKPSDFIGSCKITVKDLLEPKTDILQLVNKKNEKSGKLFLKCKSSTSDLTYCDFKACAVDLVEKKIHGKTSDPFFIIKAPENVQEEKNVFGEEFNSSALSKIKAGIAYSEQKIPGYQEYRTVYESKIIRGSLNPDWGIFQLGFYELCRANPDTKLLIECYDYNDFIPNRFIGSVEIVARELINTHGPCVLTLLSKKHKKESGTILLSCKLSNVFSTPH